MARRAVEHPRRYRPFRTIARTAAGDLLEAVEATTGDRMTLEVLRDTPPGPDDAVRLRDAIEALRSIPPHTNLLHVMWTQLDLTSDRPWVLAVEPVQGRVLADWVLDTKPSMKESLRIGADIATGLQVAHDAGVVHGALSFRTVLVTDAGIAKVMDFGLLPPTIHPPSKQTDAYALALLISTLPRMTDRSELPTEVASLVEQAGDAGTKLRPSAFAAALRRVTEGPWESNLLPSLTERPPRPAEDVPSVRERSATRESAPPEPVVVKAAPAKSQVAEPPVAPRPVAPTPAIPEGRRPRRSLRRPMIGVALLALLVAGGLAWLFYSDGRAPTRGPRDSSPARHSASSPAAAIPLVVVPDMIGLTATEARQRLIMAGLELDEIRPFVGPPGEVIASKPIAGETVEIGSPVILIIGVEPGRLTSATRSP